MSRCLRQRRDDALYEHVQHGEALAARGVDDDHEALLTWRVVALFVVTILSVLFSGDGVMGIQLFELIIID